MILSVLRRLLPVLAVAILCLLSSAIRAADAPKASIPVAIGRPDYQLQPGDQIQILVFQEDDLKQQVRISQDFMINLPLIGQVNLKGKRSEEHTSELQSH